MTLRIRWVGEASRAVGGKNMPFICRFQEGALIFGPGGELFNKTHGELQVDEQGK